MTYDTVAAVSQVTTLLLFMGLFIIVVAYVFWPANREKFEKASRGALDPDKRSSNGKGR